MLNKWEVHITTHVAVYLFELNNKQGQNTQRIQGQTESTSTTPTETQTPKSTEHWC